MIYLDNGATSFPKPPGMTECMKVCMDRYCGNPGRSGHQMSLKTGEEIYKARKTVARVLGVRNPERVVFTLNTTASLNMGIKGALCAGDHAVTTAMEHNSVLRPLKALEQCGVSHTIVGCAECGSVSVSDLRAALREDTRLVVCTHASNVTGTLQDIRAIGRMIYEMNENRPAEKRILFMVDGAQSAGCVPIDVDAMGIDILAVPGHKGLLGPLGTGALYVRESVDLWPIIEGGTGTASKDREQPLELPEGFESGTVNAPGIIGLGYSAAWVENVGVANIQKYEEELVRPLHEALCNMRNVRVYGPRDCRRKTAVVTFNVVEGGGADGADGADGVARMGASDFGADGAPRMGASGFGAGGRESTGGAGCAAGAMGSGAPRMRASDFGAGGKESTGDAGCAAGAMGSGAPRATGARAALSCEEVADRLAREYGIAVRGGFHCAGLAHRTIGTWDTGAVRMSAGPFNTKKQIKTAIDAVYKISKSI